MIEIHRLSSYVHTLSVFNTIACHTWLTLRTPGPMTNPTHDHAHNIDIYIFCVMFSSLCYNVHVSHLNNGNGRRALSQDMHVAHCGSHPAVERIHVQRDGPVHLVAHSPPVHRQAVEATRVSTLAALSHELWPSLARSSGNP